MEVYGTNKSRTRIGRSVCLGSCHAEVDCIHNFLRIKGELGILPLLVKSANKMTIRQIKKKGKRGKGGEQYKAALKGVVPKKLFKGVRMYIFNFSRIKGKGGRNIFRKSSPCETCANLIDLCGIKRVWYTENMVDEGIKTFSDSYTMILHRPCRLYNPFCTDGTDEGTHSYINKYTFKVVEDGLRVYNV